MSTSQTAYAQHEKSGRLATNRQTVLEIVKQNPRLTSAEIAEHAPFDLTETRRRLSDLKKLSFVEAGDARKCTVKGSLMDVWWVKPKDTLF